MDELAFSIPLVPPSVNHYVKHTRSGRHYKTKEAIAFLAAVPICAGNRPVRHKFYTIEIILTLPPKAKLDCDNSLKVILDGLVQGGQIHSDAAVTGLCVHKRRGAKAETWVRISRGADVREGADMRTHKPKLKGALRTPDAGYEPDAPRGTECTNRED